MLVRMWSKENTPPLLVGVQTCINSLEINLVVSWKPGNSSISRLSYTAPGHIPKRCSTIWQGHMLNYYHSSFITKLWDICTMVYYSAIKNKDIMKFPGKWMKFWISFTSVLICTAKLLFFLLGSSESQRGKNKKVFCITTAQIWP